MNEILEIGQSILAAQPFSEFVGARMTEYSENGVELRLEIKDELKQQHGFAHGGVVAYLADNALTFAGGFAMGGGVLTSEIKVNFLRPAIGEQLVARAKAISAGRNQGVVRCEIYVVSNGKEKMCAAAQGTVARTNKSTREEIS